MPAIKTGAWLKRARSLASMPLAELAKQASVTPDMISKIESGARKGSGETWDKLLHALNVKDSLVSFDSEELIEEIKQDIAEFGADEECWLFYDFAGDNILFTNYDFIEPEAPITTAEIGDEKIMRSTLGATLELLEHQDRII